MTNIAHEQPSTVTDHELPTLPVGAQERVVLDSSVLRQTGHVAVHNIVRNEGVIPDLIDVPGIAQGQGAVIETHDDQAA